MKLLRHLNVVQKGNDEFTDNLFLMDNPYKITIIMIAYLAFIFKIGPQLMKNRKAFVLKDVLMVYNIFQILFSLYICIQAVRTNEIAQTLLNPDCKVTRDRQSQINKYWMAYCYFLAKVTDLLDTVFFVLRKKPNQVTFLHVYHHVVMALATWAFFKYNPGEEFAVGAILNPFVHVLMYTYYLIASLGPKFQKYLWWKKYMTAIQLVQFLLVMLFLIVIVAKRCTVSKILITFTMFNLILFFYLFYDFYRKTYNKSMMNK